MGEVVTFRIHRDCAGQCQVAEHKGYARCDQTSGECQYLRDNTPTDEVEEGEEE